MSFPDRPLNRRDALGAISAVGLASIAAARSPAAAAAPGSSDQAGVPAGTAPARVDLAPPRANLNALLKILGSTDSREVACNFGAGRVYACIAGRAPIPLFGTHSISVARGQLKPDGSFVLRQHIVGFRTRFETEEVIDEMTNPVTGDTIQLPLTDYGLYDSEYRTDGTYALVKPEPRRISALGWRPWSEAGGIVAMSDDAVQSEPGPNQPKIDVVTRYAMASELLDPRVTSAASWFSFSAVDPFRPFLKMRDAGLQLWHVYGRKVRSPDELPAYIRSVAKERFPKLFDVPAF